MSDCILDRYTCHVAKSKCTDSKNRVNHRLLAQLEELHLPLLLEIIRVQNKAINRVMEKAVEGVSLIDTDADDMLGICTQAHIAVEELASNMISCEFAEYASRESEEPLSD
jgi:hypothetical protein